MLLFSSEKNYISFNVFNQINVSTMFLLVNFKSNWTNLLNIQVSFWTCGVETTVSKYGGSQVKFWSQQTLFVSGYIIVTGDMNLYGGEK